MYNNTLKAVWNQYELVLFNPEKLRWIFRPLNPFGYWTRLVSLRKRIVSECAIFKLVCQNLTWCLLIIILFITYKYAVELILI